MRLFILKGSTYEEQVLERVGDRECPVENFKRARIIEVDVPTDPVFESRAFVTFYGHEAEERALQLNGRDIGNWKALVKFAPEEEEEEFKVAVRYKNSLYQDLASDKRFFFGVAVWGYDTSLPKDEIDSKLRAHFTSCGDITHVYVCLLDGSTNIYFSNIEGEARALDLNGSQLGVFKITTVPVATATERTNPRLAPGDVMMVGYCFPAHFVEFAGEMDKKFEDYMTEWRAKTRREKVRALRQQWGEGQGEEGSEVQKEEGQGEEEAEVKSP